MSLILKYNIHDLYDLLDEFNRGCTCTSLQNTKIRIPISLFDDLKNKYVSWNISKEIVTMLIINCTDLILDNFEDYITSCLISVNSEEELDGKIDEILDNNVYFDIFEIFLKLNNEPISFSELHYQIKKNISLSLGNKYYKIDEYIQAIINGIDNWNKYSSQEIQQYIKNAKDKQEILWYLGDYSIPVEIQHLLLCGSKILPYLITYKVLSDKNKELKYIIMDKLILCSKEFLKLLASFNFTKVSEKLIPMSERLDLYDIFMQHFIAEKRFAENLAEDRVL